MFIAAQVQCSVQTLTSTTQRSSAKVSWNWATVDGRWRSGRLSARTATTRLRLWQVQGDGLPSEKDRSEKKGQEGTLMNNANERQSGNEGATRQPGARPMFAGEGDQASAERGPRRRSPFELSSAEIDGENASSTGYKTRPRSKLAEQNEKIRTLLGLEKPKAEDEAALSTSSSTEPSAEKEDQTPPSTMLDITGDGGVYREEISQGTAGKRPSDSHGIRSAPGCRIRVHYVGKLADSGRVFDSSRDRQEPFEFTLGEGSVIKGWEAGLVGLAPGDTVRLVCAPGYAYGLRGVPPVIPPRAKLEFEIQVLDVIPTTEAAKLAKKGKELRAPDEDDLPRTPEDIARAYVKRIEERNKNPSKKSEWFIISPFASSTGERPPWWLNPNITFLIIFSVLGLATYVVYVSGGIRQGFPSP